MRTASLCPAERDLSSTTTVAKAVTVKTTIVRCQAIIIGSQNGQRSLGRPRPGCSQKNPCNDRLMTDFVHCALCKLTVEYHEYYRGRSQGSGVICMQQKEGVKVMLYHLNAVL